MNLKLKISTLLKTLTLKIILKIFFLKKSNNFNLIKYFIINVVL
jgi:hypothetical protein